MKDAGETFFDSDSIKTSLPGVEYWLNMRPALKKQAEVNVGLYLFLKTDDTKINARYSISIGSAFKKELTYNFGNSYLGWGWDKICSRDDLFNPDKKFIVDGKMMIKLEGTLKALDLKRKTTSEVSTLGQLLSEHEERKFIIAVAKQQVKVIFIYYFIFLLNSIYMLFL